MNEPQNHPLMSNRMTLVEAGNTVTKRPQAGEFGGIYQAMVRDPNGATWVIVVNPGWRVDDPVAFIFS